VLELEGNSGLPGDHSSALPGWSSKKSARVVTRSDAFIPGCKYAVLAVAERFDLIAR
jgi:hypothetical protein